MVYRERKIIKRKMRNTERGKEERGIKRNILTELGRICTRQSIYCEKGRK